jgi:hypothetical protein
LIDIKTGKTITAITAEESAKNFKHEGFILRNGYAYWIVTDKY